MMTTQTADYLNDKATLFIDQIELTSNNDAVLEKLITFFKSGTAGRHVLFKSSSLHFVEASEVLGVDNVSSRFSGDYYLRFDGSRVSRIDPDYYLGISKERSESGFGIRIEYSSGHSSNNNNNNNNNNGNNNG